MWMRVVSIAICTGEMLECQISKGERRCLALWPVRNFRGRTLPLVSMARSLPNVFTIALPMAKSYLALWLGRNFIGGTLSLGMPMARPLPNVFTIAAECVYDRITDGKVFNAWVEQFLVATLKPGQVVLMNNGAFHTSQDTEGHRGR
jgi:hypothetical protein